MNRTPNVKYWICFVLMAVVLVADQWLKIWVKTHMLLGEEINLIGEWCKLNFIENEGMAFGFAFGGSVGKLMLTLFRLVASVGLVWFLLRQLRKNVNYLHVISLSLIIVGAVGNLIDSCFYGIVFSESYPNLAVLFPEGGGYGTLLHGRVVDMFYFPLIEGVWPSWMPVVGGRQFEFFSAVFNIADAAITIGVVLLIIDQITLSRKTVVKTVDGNE